MDLEGRQCTRGNRIIVAIHFLIVNLLIGLSRREQGR